MGSWGAPITPEQALQYAAVLSTGVGCGDDGDVLTCLQGTKVHDIVALTDIFPDQAAFPWQAVPDSLFTSSPFLPVPAEELLQTGQFNSDIEVITGTCKDEGLSDFADAWLDPDFFEMIRSTFDTAGTARILGLMRYSEVTPEDVENARKIIDAYVGGVENITLSNIQYMLTHRGQYSIAE